MPLGQLLSFSNRNNFWAKELAKQQNKLSLKSERTTSSCSHKDWDNADNPQLNGSHVCSFFQGLALRNVLFFPSWPGWNHNEEPGGFSCTFTQAGMGVVFSASPSPIQSPFHSVRCKYTHSHPLTLVTFSKV